MAKISAAMKAAFIERTGPADMIQYGDLPVPIAGPSQILVKTKAVAVDPVDTYIRAGNYHYPLPFPYVIGRDLVGTVAQIGPGAIGFAEGDWVWSNSLGIRGNQGSFSEYALVEADRLFHLPAGFDPLQGVSVLHMATAAFTGLVLRVGGVHPGMILLVGGGGGNVGSTVIQMATAMGAISIGTAHGEEDMQWCRESRAMDVFDYTDPELEAKVRRAVPDGVDVSWNTGGHNDLDMEVGLLARGGWVVLMAGRTQRPDFPVSQFYDKGARVVGFNIDNLTTEELSQAAKATNQLLAEGRLRARIARVLPLSESAEAHRLVDGTSARGKVAGRVVVTVV